MARARPDLARYRVEVRATLPVAVALRVEGSLDNLAPERGDIVSTTHSFARDSPADAALIITGPSRGGLAQEVMVSVAYTEPEHEAPIGGGCSTGGAPSNALIAALLAFGFARRRRRRVTSSR